MARIMRPVVAATLCCLLAISPMSTVAQKGKKGGQKSSAGVSVGASNEMLVQAKQKKGKGKGSTSAPIAAMPHSHHTKSPAATDNFSPSAAPTQYPHASPSGSPIAQPSASPTKVKASNSPSTLVVSSVPTLDQSEVPSFAPTVATTQSPSTDSPTPSPSAAPILVVTSEPTVDASTITIQPTISTDTENPTTVAPTTSTATDMPTVVVEPPNTLTPSVDASTRSPTNISPVVGNEITSNAPSAEVTIANTSQSISIEMYPMRMQLYYNQDENESENVIAEATTRAASPSTASTTTEKLIELTSLYMLYYFQEQLSDSYEMKDIVLTTATRRRKQRRNLQSTEDEADLEITLHVDAHFGSFPVPTKRTLAQISHEAFSLENTNAEFVSQLQNSNLSDAEELSRTNRVKVTILDGSNSNYNDPNANGSNNGESKNTPNDAAKNNDNNNSEEEDMTLITGVAVAGTAMTLFVIALLARSFKRRKRREKGNVCDELLYGDLLFDDDDESAAVNSLIYDNNNPTVTAKQRGRNKSSSRSSRGGEITTASSNGSHTQDITRVDSKDDSAGVYISSSASSTTATANYQAVRLGMDVNEFKFVTVESSLEGSPVGGNNSNSKTTAAFTNDNAQQAQAQSQPLMDDYLSCSSSSAEGDESPKRPSNFRFSSKSNYELRHPIEHRIRNSAHVHHRYFGDEDDPVVQIEIPEEEKMSDGALHHGGSSKGKDSSVSLGQRTSSDFSGAMSWYRR